MATDKLLEVEYNITDETSDPILLESFTFNNQRKYRPKIIVFTLLPISSGAIGRVQFTFDIKDRIENGTAQWFDWKFGDVSDVTTVLIHAHISAFRVVATGEMRLVARGD